MNAYGSYGDVLTSSAISLMSHPDVSAIAKLECFARTFCGLQPDGDFVLRGINNIRAAWFITAKPELPQQALVEAAYICLGFLRKPSLWYSLAYNPYQEFFLHFLAETDKIIPLNNNWILFPAIVQLFRNSLCDDKDVHKIVAAVNIMENWYRGDSIYSDGPDYQVDYYNSYVIHPMLLEIMTRMPKLGYDIYLKRAQRYAVILENLISPEGTFPVMGRSSTYRFGAFAHLSDMLRRGLYLGDTAAACNALTKVIHRMMLGRTIFGLDKKKTTTFDDRNILTIGMVGAQTQIAEYYISEGSSYLCCLGLSHLSVPKEDPMWNNPDATWTQQKIWSGKNDLVLAKGIKL